jgi:hypothetical protein
METITTWMNQPATQEAVKAMLPSVPIAVAILLHAILTRPPRQPARVPAPSKRAEARIR